MVAKGLGEMGGWGMIANGNGIFEGGKNVLKLTVVILANSVNILKNH